MALLLWIGIGAALGLLAGLLPLRNGSRDLLVPVLIGVAGALLGGFVGRLAGHGAWPVPGALAMILLYRLSIARRRR